MNCKTHSKKKLLAFVLCFATLSANAKNVLPDTLTKVNLDNQNPNLIECVDGDINDYTAPKHIPMEVEARGKNLFVGYLFRQSTQGLEQKFEFLTTPHIMHVVCDGLVYSLNITPSNGRNEKIYLGDPNLASIKEGAKLTRKKSDEELMVELNLAAINNDLPPQYSVTRESRVMPSVFSGLKIIQRRKVVLNGVGFVLKEYEVFSDSETQLSKRLFIKRDFSEKMRSVTLVPEYVTPSEPARLFIVEDK